MTVELGIQAFRRDLAEVLNRVAYGGERAIIHRHGRPQAVIIPVEDFEFLERMAAAREDAQDRKALRNARRQRDKAIPLADVAAELGVPQRRRRKSA